MQNNISNNESVKQSNQRDLEAMKQTIIKDDLVFHKSLGQVNPNDLEAMKQTIIKDDLVKG